MAFMPEKKKNRKRTAMPLSERKAIFKSLPLWGRWIFAKQKDG
jgi:hypothetical protein